jgi:hypothetical protein
MVGHDAFVANMLVTPTEEGPWRADVEALATFLASRWPNISRERREGQQRDLWSWPDNSEVWVPSEQDCVWLAADAERVSAIAVWLSDGAMQRLILCDEGYNDHLELTTKTEVEVLAWMLD